MAPTEKYPIINLSSIKVVARPKTGEAKVFFNPRQPSSFDPIKMASLLASIRVDGLLEPIVVARFSDRDEVLLIAGERRFRSISKAVEKDLPVYDSTASTNYKKGSVVITGGRFGKIISKAGKKIKIQYLDEENVLTEEEDIVSSDIVFPTAPASKVFSEIACKVFEDPSEDRMMRIAAIENQESEPLASFEEVEACERLAEMGYKQKQICYMLDQSVTWVSQTLSFRKELPKECFKAFMEGRMKRGVAVKFLSYKKEDREKLYEEAIRTAEEETEEKLRRYQETIDSLEAKVDKHTKAADAARKDRDAEGLKRNFGKTQAAKSQLEKEKKKKSEALKEKGTVSSGHLAKAASGSRSKPKTAKMLSKQDVETFYIKNLKSMLGEAEDPNSGEPIPDSMLHLSISIAQSIIAGNLDPIGIICSHIKRYNPKVSSSSGYAYDDSGYDDDDFDDDFDDRDDIHSELHRMGFMRDDE